MYNFLLNILLLRYNCIKWFSVKPDSHALTTQVFGVDELILIFVYLFKLLTFF
jgi:hypothetical protein